MKKSIIAALALVLMMAGTAFAETQNKYVYEVGQLKTIDSTLKVKEGEKAPDFTLPSINDGEVTLSDYRGKKNVVLSFVPAAFTPVCSDQWPGYNIMRDEFEKYDAVLLGITVDNIPSLSAWTSQMGGVWFPVLSDFYAHGATAIEYGILRSEGVSERALFVIDKQGVIRLIHVNDINRRPDAGIIFDALKKLK
jgi:peroxiredoxin (alkyl hydroperoxide reductase subunit C)